MNGKHDKQHIVEPSLLAQQHGSHGQHIKPSHHAQVAHGSQAAHHDQQAVCNVEGSSHNKQTARTQQARIGYIDCLGKSGLHRMAYREWGDPQNDHVLLCIHGLTRNGRDFDQLAQALSDRYRVICPDIAGRGLSHRLLDPSQYRISTYLGDCVSLLARINARRISFLGTSMGGVIGMLLAGLSSHQKMRYQCDFLFDRMILNDIGTQLNPAGLQRIAQHVGKPAHFQSLDEAVVDLKQSNASFGPLTDDQWYVFAKAFLTQDEQGFWRPDYDPAIAQAFVHEYDKQTQDRSRSLLTGAFLTIAVPILILRGGQSDLFSAETAQSMLAANPYAREHVFDGVGHAPSLIPDEQIAVVRDFLLAD